jgi:hypothetical protein
MTIKPLLLPLIFLFYTFPLAAQTEFAPIGAEWVYNVDINYFDSMPHPLVGYFTIKCTGDTVINNLYFRKAGDYFLHQEGDKVWFWYQDGLRLIYDFGLQMNDTVTFNFLSCDNGGLRNCTYKVIEIDTIWVDNQPLKKFELMDQEDCFVPYIYTYIEKIGSFRNLVESNSECIVIPEHVPEWLRCYTDSLIAYKTPTFLQFNVSNCYYTPPNSATDFHEGGLTIAPNPVVNIAVIQSEKLPVTAVFVMDPLGRFMLNRQTQESFSLSLDFSGFPSGIYTCGVLCEGKWYLGRVVKQ